MQFCLLGPVQIWNDERCHNAGTWKEQCVLAILLMERGRPVAAQTLADRLWDEQLPNKFRETLQAHISRLRGRLRMLGAQVEMIKSSRAGYQMNVAAEQVDALRFDQLAAQAGAVSAAEPRLARDLLVQAEALWNGEPLAGIEGDWAEATRQMLVDKRRAALLRRIELDLQLGDRKDEIIAELTALSSAGRVDQRVTALLMRALDAAGRVEDALSVYEQVRVRLLNDSGADPRPELRVLHVQILNGTAGQTPANTGRSTASPVHTLDLNPPFLAGRDEELAEIVSEVDTELKHGTGVAIVAIDGMAGIGKSAFATRAAYELSARCPDGALQIKLRSYDPHQPPLDPQHALTQLLDMIATPTRELGRADNLAALAAIWRRRTSGRRLLIVLDDVQDARQIEPLIPTSPGTVVLITSRRRLSGLTNIRRHTLSLLPDTAVLALLEHITGREFAADHEHAAHFTRRCGGLPLAVNLAAGHLGARPLWSLGDLVARLNVTSHTLADDPLTGPIHTAFALSYRALEPELRTLLRRMAVHPGPDISLPAAGALAAAGPPETAVRLDALVDHRLIEHTGPHRFRLHDLLREFLLGQRTDDQRADDEIALGRVYEFYQAAAALADHALNPHRRTLDYPAPSVPLEGLELETAEQARAWLDSEHHNLAAIISHARQHGHNRIGLLPHVLVQHLDHRGHWRQALDIINGQLLSARPGPSTQAVDATTARLLTDQAALFIRVDELDDALAGANAALTAWIAIGDDYGQADAYIQLGRIHSITGRPAQAGLAYRAAVDLYERIGDQNRLAVAEIQWGIIVFVQGHHDEAFAHAYRAADLARASQDAEVQCDVLTNLGEMHRLAGHNDEALVHLQEAQRLAERLGDPLNTAVLGNNIGALQESAGDHERALESFHTALHLFQTIGDHRNEIDSLVNLAGTHTRLGQHTVALAELENATTLAQRTRDLQRQSEVHLAIGDVHRAQEDHSHALISYRAALSQALQAAVPLGQARAHRALGDTLAALDDHDAAHRHWQQADELHRQLD